MDNPFQQIPPAVLEAALARCASELAGMAVAASLHEVELIESDRELGGAGVTLRVSFHLPLRLDQDVLGASDAAAA
ncbi:hypothetical protein [Chitinimonas koreensis]|uniref:hypothetical protein n=1 Tax=Chitinimonas koreensis TaxID=356302 RepID=UPI000422D4DB|nr:hypothetical protein [Chitinimonas koreensis]QNM98469.1 hypothetical protein H9L41_09690 [Chitinimonas koreensis]